MPRGAHVGEDRLGGGRVERPGWTEEAWPRVWVTADMGGGGVGGAGGGRVTGHAPTEPGVLSLLLHPVLSLKCEEKYPSETER